MRTLPIGFFLTAVIVYLSMQSGSWSMYFNQHAITVVLGGTITILIMSSPWSALKNLGRAIFEVFGKPQNIQDYRTEFQSLMKNRSLSAPSKNELIHYAQELWEQGVDPELFIVLVSQRREELERGYIDAVQALRNLAKYPPALGMLGTVMGLVSLFSVLGNDNKNTLGPSLGLAMTATFFGLVVANCIVSPLADHLHVKHMQNEKMYTGIYQVLILINRGEASTLVDDEVRGRAAS